MLHRIAPLLAALALLVAVAPAAAAQAPGSTPSPRVLYRDGHDGRRLMDGAWFHRADPQDVGLQAGFARQSSLEGWNAVQVPHAWNATDISIPSQIGTVGWYRTDFRLPRAGRATGWRIRFESANYRATVFLNGRRVGAHEGAYIPFEVVADRVSRRRVNRLVVRIDNRRGEGDLPPGRVDDEGNPGGGWWNYGGLLREVYLRKVDRVAMTGFLARPILPCRRCDATVLLRATVQNTTRSKQKVNARATVGGLSARFRPVTLPRGGTRTLSARVKVEGPRLWEPDHPALYRVRAAVAVGARKVAGWSTHIGIRSIRVTPGGTMLLNGRPVALRGASMHEDDPVTGAALTPARRAQMFGWLEELGATITRAHYPLHPKFLEMADRAGILVWNQIPFYQVPGSAIRRQDVRDKGVAYLRDTIARDQNHPSVFAWSVANELSGVPSAAQAAYIGAAARLIHKADPTRLAAIDVAGHPGRPKSAAYGPLDAIGINTYFGWYPGPEGSTANREALSAYLDQMHANYRSKALFATEFGAEANHDGPADEKSTYAFQRNLLQHFLATYAQKPWLNGAVAWILQDFKVRPGWQGGSPKPGSPYNQKGLVDQFGAKKPAFDDVARMYRDVDPLR
ncbi:MAG: hypothetical protein M3N16_07565 [Actinomycetota bacterium]|nr:hypothetical protein [Actinomycetota bacterium]